MLSLKDVVLLSKLPATYYTLIISCYGFLYGMDISTLSASLSARKVHFGLSSVQLESISAISSLSAILGIILVISFGSKLSRKITLALSTVAYVFGVVIYGVSKGFSLCIVGRILVGIANGISLMIAPVFIGEISPKEYRGLYISFNLTMLNLGIPLGFTLAMLINSRLSSSRWLFVITGALSFVSAILLLWVVPHSPRDLIFRGQASKAKEIIQKLHSGTPLNDKELASEVDSLASSIQAETAPRFLDLFRPPNRRSLIIACTLQVAKQLSGFNTLQCFSSYIFRIVGLATNDNPQLPSIILGIIQFLSTTISLGAIDFLGRRRLLLVSSMLMAAGLVVLGGSFVMVTGFDQINKPQCADYIRCGSCLLDTACGWSKEAGKCMPQQQITMDPHMLTSSCPMSTTRERVGGWLVVSSFIFSLGSMGLGLGSIPWVIQAEIFSQALRSKGSGVASISNWVFSYISAASFLHLAFVITLPGVFWLYAVLLVATILSVYWAIPETAGKTLEEIAEDSAAYGSSSRRSCDSVPRCALLTRLRNVSTRQQKDKVAADDETFRDRHMRTTPLNQVS